MRIKKMMTGFLLLMVLPTVINSPLFGLNEYRSLQMKQESSKSRVAEEGQIWFGRTIFFTVSEVYYGSDSHQKLVIYKPFFFKKTMFNQSIRGNADGAADRMEFRIPEGVFIEVPGGGGSGNNVSIDDPPSLRGVAMLMRNIPVAVVDYRPLLEYHNDPETPIETRKRIAFIWDQHEDLILALRKIREMGFEVFGTFGYSYGAYLCAVTEAKSPGSQGRLFLGAGMYDVFSAIEYWFHWFGVYLPGESLLNEWSPGNTYFEGDNVFIACPTLDHSVSPTHSFWLKDKWPKSTLKEYPAGHSFVEVEKELLEDVIKWILCQEPNIQAP